MKSNRKRLLARRRGRARQIAKREPNGRAQRSGRDDGTAETRSHKSCAVSRIAAILGYDKRVPIEASDDPLRMLLECEVIDDAMRDAGVDYRVHYRKFIGSPTPGRAPIRAEDDPEGWRVFKDMQRRLGHTVAQINQVCGLGIWPAWMLGASTERDRFRRAQLIAGLKILARKPLADRDKIRHSQKSKLDQCA